MKKLFLGMSALALMFATSCGNGSNEDNGLVNADSLATAIGAGMGGSVNNQIKTITDSAYLAKLSKEEMLNWDKNRFKDIHEIAKNYTTKYTHSGKILYYLDANGRYDTLDRLQSFVDYAKEIGALDQIVLLEEPFEEFNKNLKPSSIIDL